MAHLSLALFGPLKISLDSAPITGFEYNKVRGLLVYLAVESDRPHTRDHLIGLLWPELPERLARQNLSQALLNLRQSIHDQAAIPSYLSITRDTLQFNRASDFSLDIEEFLACLQACEIHRHRTTTTCLACSRRLARAVELFRGDFLAEFYLNDSAPFEEWALVRRERFHQHAIGALTHLADFHERRGQYERAVQYTHRQLELDPWREEASRQLMRLLALNGERSAALMQYNQCVDILQKELGVLPQAETTALFRRIRAAKEPFSELANELLRWQPPPTNLPAPPTPMVGREEEVDKLCARLLEDVRLITLTGSPGIGKTRMALEAASRLRLEFEAGVFFVPLAAIQEADYVADAITIALGLRIAQSLTPQAALIQYLRSKQVLLLLDNFEQILEASSLVAEILEACPEVRILVTSRAALRIRAEYQVPLSPLEIPERGGKISVKAAARFAAVALFNERAQAILPDFILTDENIASVVEICRWTEGLPLAIELVTALFDRLPLDELLTQLDHRLTLFADGPRDLPSRQKTLRSSIAWSYDLLGEGAQQLFRWSGVFLGGFSREAMQAIAREAYNEEFLAAVVHQSLIQRKGKDKQHERFESLEAIREFAWERLVASGEAETLQERHSRYFSTLAEKAEAELVGANQEEWLEILEGENENLRAALAWGFEKKSMETIARLLGGLYNFWIVRGHQGEGNKIARSFLDTDQVVLPGNLRAKALYAAGHLAYSVGDYNAARDYDEQSLELYRHAGDRKGIAEALFMLGGILLQAGEYQQAVVYSTQSLEIFRQLGEPRGLLASLTSCGVGAMALGNFHQAHLSFQEGMQWATAQQDIRQYARLMTAIGTLAINEGKLDLARENFQACLSIFRKVKDTASIARVLNSLGDIARCQEDYDKAEIYLEESLEIARELGVKYQLALSLYNRGCVAVQQGNLTRAEALFQESLSLHQASGSLPDVAGCLAGFASVRLRNGHPKSAVLLFSAAQAAFAMFEYQPVPPDRTEFEHDLAAARKMLSLSEFTQLWTQGQAISLEEGCQMALGGKE